VVQVRAPEPPAPAPAGGRQEAAAGSALDLRRREILDAFEGLKAKNHFEVLAIPKASNEAQVKEAYFRLARRFHPDTHHDPNLADLRDKIEAVFIRLGEAYEVLRDRNKRSSYESDLASRTPRAPGAAAAPAAEPAVDPSAEGRMVEESIRRAERYITDEKYWDAIQLLEPTVHPATGKWKARARLALARAYVKNPHWVKRAEEQLQSAVREDPRHAEAFFMLGNLYKQSGMRSRALSMFRKALEAKPDFEQAATELAGLTPEEPESPPEGGGLLKKIFGRS
jgi:curved DNA-binding protein CbpA